MIEEQSFDRYSLIRGDCLEVMHRMQGESVDLIYSDPPFFTERDFGEFTDKWSDGIDEYLGWIRPRLQEMHRLLKPTGSIYLHCDWHASHYIKVEMDKIFGYKNFCNELVWRYQSVSMTAATRIYPRKHDTILFYAKNVGMNTFNAPREDNLSDQMSKRWGKYTDPDGETIRYGSIKHEPSAERRAKKRIIKSLGRLPQDDDVALSIRPSLVRSVWNDINEVRNNARYKESIGYPTQKPLALLERIIKASSNEGDLVLDPFVGSGTTVVAAVNAGRRCIGIDLSIDTAGERVYNNSIGNL